MNNDKITSVIKDFFHKIHADEVMNKFFKDHDQERIQHHPETFLSHGLGEGKYTNEQIANAHSNIDINNEHFESMVGHFIKTLDDNGYSEADKKKIEGILHGYKGDILGK